jgi:hypothetical protein
MCEKSLDDLSHLKPLKLGSINVIFTRSLVPTTTY